MSEQDVGKSPSISLGSRDEKVDDSSAQHVNTSQETQPSEIHLVPPDGGLWAWLSVLGGCLVLFNAWGLVQAFGAYQAFYTTNTLSSYDASAISWIGTIEAWLLVFIGVVTGPIFDHGYLRTLLITGSCLVVFGVMMLSLATEYYQIMLSQAICVGLGSGMLFTPALAQVTVSFSTKRPIALALTTAGVGLGGIVYPAVFDELEPRIGFAWTTRVIGFIALATLATAIPILTWKKPPPRPPRSLFDFSALREPPFIVYTIAIFVMFSAYWVPWFYIPLFGRFGAGASRSFSFYLLSITNACSIVGRLMSGLLQRWFTALQLLVVVTTLCGILTWSWISIHTVGSFVAFCVFWGLISGNMAVLPASAVAELSPTTNVVGARMGMAWAASSFGVLIGGPIGGAASDPKQNDFLGAQAYAGACLFASTLLYAMTILLLHRSNRKKKDNQEET